MKRNSVSQESLAALDNEAFRGLQKNIHYFLA